MSFVCCVENSFVMTKEEDAKKLAELTHHFFHKNITCRHHHQNNVIMCQKHQKTLLNNDPLCLHKEKEKYQNGSGGEARQSASARLRQRRVGEDDVIETRERRSGRFDDDSDDDFNDFNDFNDEQQHK